jgi:hypothetical protein
MYVEYGYNGDYDLDQEARQALAQANGFSPAALAKNARGGITLWQRVKLIFRAVTPVLGLIVPSFGLIVLAGLVYLCLPYLGLGFRSFQLVSKVFLPVISAVGFGLLAILAKTILASRRLTGLLIDLLAGRAAHIMGRVSVTRSEEVEDGLNQLFHLRTNTYFYTVKGQQFEVSEEAHAEMFHLGGGGWYTIYYTPRSKFLLSIEPGVGQRAQIPETPSQAA